MRKGVQMNRAIGVLIVFCMLAVSTASGQLVTDGLEAYLDFSVEPSGTTVIEWTG